MPTTDEPATRRLPVPRNVRRWLLVLVPSVLVVAVAVPAGLSRSHHDEGGERVDHTHSHGTSELSLAQQARHAAGAADPGATGHRHGGCEEPPTDEERARADRFAREVRASLTRHGWDDFDQAVADGYGASSGGRTNPTGHYANVEFGRDGRLLDPERPEVLWFGPAGKLLAAMFVVTEVYEEPAPTPGGCLMGWHVHGGAQATVLPPPRVEHGARPGEDCWHDRDTRPMMHVFTAETQATWGGANPFDQGDLPAQRNAELTEPDHPNFCDHPSSAHPDADFGRDVTWVWPGGRHEHA